MFLLDDIQPVAYCDPWHLPLQERVRTLARGKTRVAYFAEKGDYSTFRYRVYNMAQVVNADGGDVSAGYFFPGDLHRLDEIADLADLLVVCRTRYDQRVHHLIGAFHKRRKKVLFDTDDLVFDTRYLHLLMHTLDVDMENPQNWDTWFAYCSRVGATLRLCDGAIATNDRLAGHIQAFTDMPVAVIPNFINAEQLELSDRIFEAKRGVSPGEDGFIHLGYFSGSPSHNRDFGIAAPALEAALDENPSLALVVVGYIQAGPRLARFGERVRYFAFQDYLNLQRLIGSVEFNLMPLQANAFTHCKSELKFFEAAVVGTQSIASPTYTYGRSIRQGDNGYLAQAHQWLTTIRRAVEEVGNYQAMAERSRRDAREQFGWMHQREPILAALGLALA